LNACVGRNGGPADFGRYSQGYFAAGALLLKQLQENPFDIDCLIYPLVMNYRYGVENALKQLAASISFLCTDKQVFFMTHWLTDNWAIAKRHLPEVDVPEKEIRQADATMKLLVEIDPKGEAFRYPMSTKLERYLQDMSIINADVFGEGMASLAEFLDSCCGWVAQHLQWKADMESEMRDCY
jgi:hypothetical protein